MLIISMKKNIKKLTKNGKLPFSEEGTLIFDDDFISDINSTTESKTRYTSVQNAVLLKRLFIFIFQQFRHTLFLFQLF